MRFLFVPLIWVSLLKLGLSQTLNYEQFTESDGLSSMTTYEIVQDSSGLLWVGTENGLVSYDGVTFERHTYPNLKDNDMVQTFIHETGEVGFVNLSNQIGLVKGDACEIYTHDFGTKVVRIFTILNHIYLPAILKVENKILNYKGPLKLERNKAFVIQREEDIEYDKFKPPYINLTNGNNEIINYRYNVEKPFVNNNLLKLDRLEYESINKYFIRYFDGKKCGLFGNGFYEPVQLDFIEHRNCSKISFFTRYNDKYLFIDNNRILSYDTITKKDVLISDDYIYTYLFIDKEEILWASTQNSGLFKFSDFGSGIVRIGEYEKDIIDISRTNNTILVTTFDESLLYDKNLNKLDSIRLKHKKRSVIYKENDKLRILNWYDRININDEKFEEGKRISNFGFKAAQVVRDSIFYGRFSGMSAAKVNEYSLDTVNSLIKLKSIRIIDFLYDEEKNNLYIATIQGLYIKEDMGKERPYCAALSGVSITAMAKLDDSSILVGSENEGFFHVRDGEVIANIKKEEGLRSNKIYEIEIQDKYAAIATNKGVSIYNLVDHSIRSLGSFEGLPSNNVNSVEFLEDGSLLVGSGKILTQIEVENFNSTKSISSLSIARILNNNIEVGIDEYLEFSHDENKIEVELKHISQRSTDLSIRYRIKEIDQTWTTIKDPFIRLPALQPGKYSVEAIGLNEIGAESNEVALTFEIHPPWWQTWWARLMGILSIVGVMSLINGYRNRQNEKREEVKREYLMKINAIKEQALQLQMNPHFIFNSLNAIQNFIGTDDDEQAMNYLARFAKLIRMIFEYSKGSKISLEEELEFMKLYLGLEKLRFNKKVEIELQISEELKEIADTVTIPPLLVQPIVENSFKHGLFHKEGKGLLKLDYSIEGDTLTISIEDNGVGRNYKKRNTHPNNEVVDIPNRTSSGIKTTKERLELLNFNSKNTSNTIEIEDLKDADNNPIGTKTIFRLDIGI